MLTTIKTGLSAVLLASVSISLAAAEMRAYLVGGNTNTKQDYSYVSAGQERLVAHDLIEVYQLAQTNDPAWASAQKANQAAQEKIIQGRAGLLPTLGISANANHAQTDIEYTGTDNVFRNDGKEQFDTYGYTVNANQPLYRPQNSIQYKQSIIQAAYADVQLTLAEQELIMRVSQAYFDVLIAQDKIALIDAQKEATEQQLQQAEKNFKVGVATVTDVNDAQAKLDLLLAQEISAQNNIEAKINALETVIGTRLDSLAKAKDNLIIDRIESDGIDDWVNLALNNSPEFLAQQKTVEYAKKEVDLNQAGHLPTLDAVGSYSYTDANGGINGFGNKLDNFTIGLQLQLPLYQGGAISSKKREAVLNYQKSLDDLEQIRRKVVLETKQAWLDVKTAVSEVRAYEQAVTSSQSQVNSTKKAFKVGLRNTVDVLNAQEQYYASQYDFNVARYTYLTNMLKLKTAVGIITNQDIIAVNDSLER